MNEQDLRSMYNFTGRTAVITGGSGILGGEIACGLAGCGANVILLDVKPIPDWLDERLRQGPGQVRFIRASVLDTEALVAAGQAIIAEFGGMDILLNAAGIHHPQATTGPALSFFDLPEEAVRLVFDTNALGTILPCRCFGRQMAEQGEGVILNISSVSSFHSVSRVPAYSAAKGAVNNFTQWLAVHMAREYSPRIRVNAIAPGFYLTDVNRSLLTNLETGELTERGRTVVAHTPMGRFGRPEELVGAALWLVSPAASFVTGIVVPVDGGFTAYSGV